MHYMYYKEKILASFFLSILNLDAEAYDLNLSCDVKNIYINFS